MQIFATMYPVMGRHFTHGHSMHSSVSFAYSADSVYGFCGKRKCITWRRRNLESLGPSNYFGSKLIFIRGKKTCTLAIFCKHISRGGPNHFSVSSTVWSVVSQYKHYYRLLMGKPSPPPTAIKSWGEKARKSLPIGKLALKTPSEYHQTTSSGNLLLNCYIES